MTATPARPDPYATLRGPALYARHNPGRRRRRAEVLALLRRPSRVAQLEHLLDRHRWITAGLRERLAVLDREHAATLTTLEALAAEVAPYLGHAHPVVLELRRIVKETRR